MAQVHFYRMEVPAVRRCRKVTADPSSLCRYFHVIGHVQGVWFRGATQETARRLGLTGWVRNREDGGVELVACGPSARLAEMAQWLTHGPPAARVASVTTETAPVAAYPDFAIRY